MSQLSVWLKWLAGLSTVTLATSVLVLPYIVSLLPCDYFHPHPATTSPQPRTPFAISTLFLLILRNAAGCLLLFAGIVMLFLPGQGLLTIVIALMLMSFPYKRQLICSLTRPVAIQHSLNWLRRKSNKPPFIW